MIKVLFVCHGNICRSTLAESLFTYLVKQEGLENEFQISSSGTSREEIGNPVHYGTVGKLREKGIPVIPHQAKQMTKQECEEYDYLIGMDSANIRNMKRIASERDWNKIHSLLSFAKIHRDIADPWYTGDFEATYQDILLGCTTFLKYIKEINK